MKQSLSRARVEGHVLIVVAFMCALASISGAWQLCRSTSTTERSSPPSTPVAKPTSSRLNVNTASAAEMEKLTGVGKILAERVVAYRQQYGPFRRVEHWLMVHAAAITNSARCAN